MNKRKKLISLLFLLLFISTAFSWPAAAAGRSVNGVSDANASLEEGTVYYMPVLKDGMWTTEVLLEGGSGRASVSSPVEITVKDGRMTARLVWSSSNYDYMIVDGEMYYPLSGEKTSVFEIPVPGFDAPVAAAADTTAMSMPHEIDYTLTFDSASLKRESTLPPAVLLPAAAVIVAGLGFAMMRGRRLGR